MSATGPLQQVLELARWAPSGDNTQPWRFEIVDDHHVAVHGFDTRESCVYDIDGRPSQLSLGALLETMDIAASTVGWAMDSRRRPGADATPTFDVRFVPAPARAPDPLAGVVRTRSVQRRPLQTRALTAEEKAKLDAAAGPHHRVVWLEGLSARWSCARLLYANARIRLTIPEAFEVHRNIIDWGRRYSDDKVPDQALGADAMTLKLMRFAMQRWERIEFMNRWLAGTVAPRLQMDLLPALACAAHFAIVAQTAPRDVDDWVAGGRAMQRLWLTATRLGLQKQPELTPVVFARYAAAGRPFSRVHTALAEAQGLRDRLADLLKTDLDSVVWMARIGAGQPPVSRSLRLPLEALILGPAAPSRRA